MVQKIPVQKMDMDRSDRVELVPGHVYRKSIGAEALGVTMFWMKSSDDPEKTLIPKHRHGEEVFYIVKGGGTITIDDVDHRVQEGDTLLIPAGAEHYGVLDDGELIILCVENPPRPGLRFYFNDVTKDNAPLIPGPSDCG
jgi:mannose-6-phosphate isomerase-like protein (cupin superfamily)